MKLKRLIAMALVAVMTLSMVACSSEETKEPAEDDKAVESTVEKPEAVSEEDWAAMQKEPGPMSRKSTS